MKTIKILLLTVLIAGLSSCRNNNDAENESVSASASTEQSSEERQGQAFVKDDVSEPTVLDIAIQSEDHKTLVAAVQAAQLENALVNAGPLMVFAPTDEAFNALPEGTVEDLLKPENENQLALILKHHVTPGKYDKEFLKKFKKLGQASDQNVPVEVKGEDVYVGGAKIIASVPAGNGIVHVVDKVIIPEN